ncbi:Antiviral helicase ski2, partial [Coemansia sp. RSA 2607]
MSDDIVAAIEQEYLLPQVTMTREQLLSMQQPVEKEYLLSEFMTLPQPWITTTMEMVRDPVTGEYCDAAEIDLPVSTDPMSITRASGRRENYATGSSSQIPFQPGGIPVAANIEDEDESDLLELCTIPDGFSRGLVIDASVDGDSESLSAHASIRDNIDADKLAIDSYWTEANSLGEQDSALVETPAVESVTNEESEIDQLATIPPNTSQSGAAAGDISIDSRKEWAHIVDVAAGFPDFHKLVPHLAREFPFELDVFQKRA